MWKNSQCGDDMDANSIATKNPHNKHHEGNYSPIIFMFLLKSYVIKSSLQESKVDRKLLHMILVYKLTLNKVTKYNLIKKND